MRPILEQQSWMDELVELLIGFDVFFVGVRCSVEELERREAARGDRQVGDARKDIEFVHTFAPYDLEVDAEKSLESNVGTMVEAWLKRQQPSVFEQLATASE